MSELDIFRDTTNTARYLSPPAEAGQFLVDAAITAEDDSDLQPGMSTSGYPEITATEEEPDTNLAEQPAPAPEAADHTDGPPPPPPPHAESAAPDDDPAAVHVYTLAPPEYADAATLTVPSDSLLIGKGLEFASRGREVPETNTGYPGKMEIIDPVKGSITVYAEATRHESERPAPTGVISEDGVPETGVPPRDRNQRSISDPPDEIRIDILPNDPREAGDAIETLLTGYVTDAVNRLTEPDAPGAVRFKPGAVEIGYTTEPVPEAPLRRELLGYNPFGVTRILLNDYGSNVYARQGEVDTPHIAAVGEALSRLGCGVDSVEAVRPEGGANPSAIEVRFSRRPGATIDGLFYDNKTGTPPVQYDLSEAEADALRRRLTM